MDSLLGFHIRIVVVIVAVELLLNSLLLNRELWLSSCWWTKVFEIKMWMPVCIFLIS